LKRLEYGNRNIDVYMVKRELHSRGYNVGTMNNYFSIAMKTAYSRWQKNLGFTGEDANGIPGVTSLRKLGFAVA
jgi:hypothetical protein